MIQATCMEYVDPFLIRKWAMLPHGGTLDLTNSNLKSNHTGLVGKENCILKG